MRFAQAGGPSADEDEAGEVASAEAALAVAPDAPVAISVAAWLPVR